MGESMSDQKKNKKSTTYYFQNPVYVTGRSVDHVVDAIMGSVWLKAVARDNIKKKYGYTDIGAEDLCEAGCDECMLCFDDLEEDEEN